MEIVVATSVASLVKRLKSLLLISLAMVISGLAACTPSPDCFRAEVFCAALVTDTQRIDDFGLNQDTWTGLQHSKADGVADHIAYIESVDARDYEKNIAYFVRAAYDVIVTSGIGLQDATLRSADLYPDTVFIGMEQADEVAAPNFISVTFPEDQMGFFAGALAARLTQTNIVGAICEASGIDAMWRYCEGFRAGADYIDENVEVLVAYRDDGSRERLFIDPDWGFENAQTLIQDGADVLFAAGGETGVGALRAAMQAQIQAIGTERDQRAALGEAGLGVVTSVLGRASFTVQELMRRIKAGNLADAQLSPIGYVPFEAFVQKAILVEMDQILLGLATREIKTNVIMVKP